MRRAGKPDWPFPLLAVLLTLTLAIKGAVIRWDVDVDNQRFARDLAAVLTRQGYKPQIIARGAQRPLIVATRGDCRLIARLNPSSYGLFAANDRVFLAPAGQMVSVYQGRYAQAPRGLVRELAIRVHHELAEVGIHYGIAPEIYLAARPGCYPPAEWLARLRLFQT